MTMLAFLSLEYSGLILALALLAAAAIGQRRTSSRWRRRTFQAVAVVAVVLAVGAVTHLVRVARIAAKYPPPGQLVDIGGYRLHVLAEGPPGGPAIVWFPGAHAGSYGFYDQHRAVRGQVRSILVDRPGSGWSDTGPFPRTTAREADEIVRALEAAGEPGPFIWAGHSFGGLLAANIARRHPEKTAAVALLDPTPLDVLFYGADKRGLASWYRKEFWLGLRRIFGLYRFSPPEAAASDAAASEAMLTLMRVEARAGTSFANSSILKELSAHGLVDRAWSTVVYDGELGALPLYLIAPGEDASTLQYAQQILGAGAEAERFANFLTATRERFLSASTNSTRIHAPKGTTHVFTIEAPEFLTQTMLRIAREVSPAGAIDAATYEKLTTAWPGPYGGLPPIEIATPALLEAAYRRAVDEKRAQVREIAADPSPPTFDNTVRALEASGVALSRIAPLVRIFSTTRSDDEVAAMAARTASLEAALDDEIAHDTRLYSRVDAVHSALPASAPTPEARRLVAVVHENLTRRGARLAPEDKQKLQRINSRLAELRTEFAQNIVEEESSLVVFIDDESGLQGLSADERKAARAAAQAKGRPDAWAIPIARPTVWSFLTNASSRPLREQVWRKWVSRGANAGASDNRPVMTEMLSLRGQKARLLGFPTFAHYQTSARMIGTPDAALNLLTGAWNELLRPTLAEIAELQAIADAEGADFELQPWDRLYYAEKLRRRKFGLDSEEIKSYLRLDKVVEAMFWAANRTFGFSFRELEDVPVVADDIRVFEVSRNGQRVGVLWLDLFQRTGKGPASWAAQYRSAESFRGRVLPLAALHSSVPQPTGTGPVLVPWERANVIFHEFGHALHMLANGASYPSLGMLTIPWDFIEVPSLLNERWLIDRAVLKRFARHHETGAPMSDELMARLERSLKHDRVFSASLNYLGTAIVDMRLHRLADGRRIDAVAEEKRVLDELGLPAAIDLILYAPHAYHTFTDEYAAGVYTYLWSDVIAADIAESFVRSPGGLYDTAVAKRYYSLILSSANTTPVAEAFRAFKGREPDPAALWRRFAPSQ